MPAPRSYRSQSTRLGHLGGTASVLALSAIVLSILPSVLRAQEPAGWGLEPVFHTFSLVALDPMTGELGATVTTRNTCVGNGVPWVRVGVGAVATQAATRTDYGPEILDLIASGLSAPAALEQAMADDDRAASRQLGVIDHNGSVGQHTGDHGPWAGERSGRNYAVQGNVLVGPEVLDAVARVFEATEGSERQLADRMIAAMEAGHAAGGDRRKGRMQSASVIVVDPRDGMARRADGQTVHINVCEHDDPVGEMRRIYDNVSNTLGYRTLQQYSGIDVWQVKLLMNALGFFRPEESPLERGQGWQTYDQEIVDAVDAFRAARELSTPDDGSPAGLVDPATVSVMWDEAEAAGVADGIRGIIRQLTLIRR